MSLQFHTYSKTSESEDVFLPAIFPIQKNVANNTERNYHEFASKSNEQLNISSPNKVTSAFRQVASAGDLKREDKLIVSDRLYTNGANCDAISSIRSKTAQEVQTNFLPQVKTSRPVKEQIYKTTVFKNDLNKLRPHTVHIIEDPPSELLLNLLKPEKRLRRLPSLVKAEPELINATKEDITEICGANTHMADIQPDIKKLKNDDATSLKRAVVHSVYDDTPPKNDNFLTCFLETRSKLGWITELPRHGPGVNALLAKLCDKPVTRTIWDKVVNTTEDDHGDFFYALPLNRHNLRSRYDPYTLQVVSTNEARQSSVFFTGSATCITRIEVTVDGEEECSSTPAIEWLRERRLFLMLYNKPLFAKFRKWKQFQIWQMNVRRKKCRSMKLVLNGHLFSTNEILLRCMQYVRQVCELATGTDSGQHESVISFVYLNKKSTLTLDEFSRVQQEQQHVAFLKLMAVQNNIAEIVLASCHRAAELEGISQGINHEDEHNGGKKFAYAEASIWRKILSRLTQFLRCVDYQLIEMMRTIVTTSLQQLTHFMLASHQAGLDVAAQEELEEAERKKAIEEAKKMKETNSDDEFADDTSINVVFAEHRLNEKSFTKASERTVIIAPELKPTAEMIDDLLADIRRQQAVKIELPQSVLLVQMLLSCPQRSRNTQSASPEDSTDELVLQTTSLQSEDCNKLMNNGLENNANPSSPVGVLPDIGETKNEDEETNRKDDDSIEEYEENEDGNNIREETEATAVDAADAALFETLKYAYTDDRSQSAISLESTLQTAAIKLLPSVNDVGLCFRNIVIEMENTIGKFIPMLREPRLASIHAPIVEVRRSEVLFSQNVAASPVSKRKDSFSSLTDNNLNEVEGFDPPLSINSDRSKSSQVEAIDSWPDMAKIFKEDINYQNIKQNLDACISRGMELTKNYAERYQVFCSMVDQAISLNIDQAIDSKPWTPEEFQQVLRIFTEQRSLMEGMVHEKRQSFIQLQCNLFRDACLPYPQHVAEVIFDRIPVIAAMKNDNLLNILRVASRKLDKKIETVEEFVQHLHFLDKLIHEMTALDNELSIIVRLYTIIKDFDIPINPEHLALYQILSPAMNQLKTQVLYAEAKKDESIRKFNIDLDNLIKKISERIASLKNQVTDPNLLNPDSMAATVLQAVTLLAEEVTELTTKARNYATYKEKFIASQSQQKKSYVEEYSTTTSSDAKDDRQIQVVLIDLGEIDRELMLRKLLWESLGEWEKLEKEWKESMFDLLNVENLQRQIGRFTQTIVLLEKGLPHNEMVPRLKEMVNSFKVIMPVITSLRNSALKQRHWFTIENITGRSFTQDRSFTLGNLLDMNIIRHKEKIQEVSTTASNEATLEYMLQKVIDLWLSTDLRLVSHSSGSSIITGADDIITLLEESLVTIGTIRGSRYVAPIKATVEEWERKLGIFAKTLEEWMTCQRNWLYLEQIFNTPDIQRQLPTEHKLFTQVDKSWRELMHKADNSPNALKMATAQGVLETLQNNNSWLDRIHKCLEDYLETKRLVFPRFYFLSNDELLDILAQSKNPDSVQPHLRKCFGNIKSLDIRFPSRQPPTIMSMISAEGEIMDMPKNVRVRGMVEHWLCNVETGMYDSVKRCLKQGLHDLESQSTEEWVLQHAGQVALTVSQIKFSADVNLCLTHNQPMLALSKLQTETVAVLNVLAGLVGTDISFFRRLSLNALLTIDVHNRDIINNMIANGIARLDDFEWKRQLRYKWDDGLNQCVVLQSNAMFVYGYEYLGCSSRLVMTPLTDRCYLTLTGALNLHLGGSPAGPAGTGKTETVKDLARAMGKQCVVFNCSEGLDYKMLGKFFSGLAQSGSWCCFDEFNRIDIEVLSVVAQQLHTIKTAKDQNLPKFTFEGRDIKLIATCGVFVTMNPSYAGRVELPDNLKVLFRPVAMMVPDYALIAEIMLFSEGFITAKSLSTKIVNLYQLASKQLSLQNHYDFGMRAIKSVLVMAGQLKRNLQISMAATTLTEEKETQVLMQSLREANIPKFLAEDVPLFESILADLFPNKYLSPTHNVYLERAISAAISELGLQPWPNQINKVKQLYDQLMVRHGVMLVGPSGGGKTAVRNILQKALTLLQIADDKKSLRSLPSGQQPSASTVELKKGRVEAFAINPKCVKLGELYGETDINTFEWSDGLIASATRKFAQSAVSSSSNTKLNERSTSDDDLNSNRPALSIKREQSASETITDWQWLVMDGPVDTTWVENLNTVLDDSKILCLANGERISLPHSMRLIFEVDDLSQASLATVSRCAMVYMDPVELGWKPYIATWLDHLPVEFPASGRKHLLSLFEHSIDVGLNFVKRNEKYQIFAIPEMSMITCLCGILTAFIDFLQSHGGFGIPENDEASTRIGSGNKDGRQAAKKKKRRGELGGKTGKVDSLATAEAQFGAVAKQYYLQRNPGNLNILLGKLFVFAFTWSFGSVLRRLDDADDDNGMHAKDANDLPNDIDIDQEFDNLVRELFDAAPPPIGVRLPQSSQTIYSYFVDVTSGNFMLWDILVPTTQTLIEKGQAMGLSDGNGEVNKRNEQGSLVPTVDAIRYSFISSLLLLNKKPVLLTGDSGVGKSAILNHMLQRLCQENGASYQAGTVLGCVLNFTDQGQKLLESVGNLLQPDTDSTKSMEVAVGNEKLQLGVASTTIQFSAQTKPARFQLALTQKLIKKGRDTLIAPKGKKVITLIDDLNLPTPERYGAQPPLELLRQFIELGGFYDTKQLCWKTIQDVTIVAACGPPGGGRHPISLRLLKHFCILALPTPSTKSLQHIYQVQLGRFLHDGEFSPEVKQCLLPLVSASIAIYYRMQAVMKPTPLKIHYTFNIRDLAKVIYGLFQADRRVISNQESCIQLFVHEATRVFHDRLTNAVDRDLFFNKISDVMNDSFRMRLSPQQLLSQPIIFADFMEPQSQSRKLYRMVTSFARLNQVLEEIFLKLQFTHPQLKKLVFFREAAEHVIRTVRVFRQLAGHMLLVGLDGTGKSTTAQMAALIAGLELYRLTPARNYGIIEFRDDLKKAYFSAGVKGQETVFLLTDDDIVDEAFLEDINCILNSGDLPDLFENDEIDRVMMELRSAAAACQIADTRPALYQFFLERVRSNLHIAISLSHAGNSFRQRCRMNPSLINCCTIDWFDEWNEEAMLAVAQAHLSISDFICPENEDVELLKNRVALTCVSMHESMKRTVAAYWDEVRRHYYITPSSYIDFIHTYATMLHETKEEFVFNRNRLLIGLTHLSDSETTVADMQEELTALGPKIEQQTKETEELLEQLKLDQEAVDEVRRIVQKEEDIVKRENEIVQEYADKCQQELAAVIPALQAAIQALDNLDKADISEIRAYTRPPELVTMVMSAVCVLLGKQPDWASAKQVLSDANFINLLINYDKASAPEKIFQKLKKYTKHPEFTPQKVGIVSKACRSMCQWVLALENYHEVHKMAKPKQKQVEETREALLLSQAKLAQKQASLAKVQHQLKLLQQQYQERVDKKEALKKHKIITALRIERSGILTTALSSEKVRWSESVLELNGKLDGLVGNTLISAGIVAYHGALTANFRKRLTEEWMKFCHLHHIPVSPDYIFSNIMDANQVLRWHNEGLPQDNQAVENAIIIRKTHHWPLLIDPQGQALRWIREMEGSSLKIVDATDPNYMRTLERTIRMGEPILIKEVGEKLDPALKPVLLKEVIIKGGITLIRLGSTEIEYNPSFRLYMTTSLSNPHYLPATCIHVTLVNFTVTFEGLQDQLLSHVVKQEKPQLENRRSQLLQSLATDNQMLHDLENKTLELLQQTEVNILDDQDLIDTLQKSKETSAEIRKRVVLSKETEQKLNTARQRYLPVATHGSILYFVLADLSAVDIMYQFSLTWFQNLYLSCIDTSDERSYMSIEPSRRQSTISRQQSGRRSVVSLKRKSVSTIAADELLVDDDIDPVILKSKMREMIDKLTSIFYRLVSVALFSHHKLMFSFMLCSSIMRARVGQLDSETSSIHKSTRSSAKGLQHSAEKTIINEVASVNIQSTGNATFSSECVTALEWQIFLQGELLSSAFAVKSKTTAEDDKSDNQINSLRPQWLSLPKWQQCEYIEMSMHAFQGLTESLLKSQDQWQKFQTCNDPYIVLKTPPTDAGSPPVIFDWSKLSTFQHLIMIKILRPSCLISSIRTFVEEHMSSQFIATGTIDLTEMYEESDAKTPLIFILSPGTDPAAQLLQLALSQRGSTNHVDMISLGQGQGPKAEELIRKAQILKGRWIFLQNCHLAASWMPRLQTIVSNFNKADSDLDVNFRLWLSSKPDQCFPVPILQSGLKITVEPPRGVKENMLRTFGHGMVNERLFEEAHPQNFIWKNMLFSLIFFNAVLLERKKYGQLGWNIPYEFNDSDLEMAVKQLSQLFTNENDIPWPALWYLTGEITYGGRVTDDMDRRCLQSLLLKFFIPEALEPNYAFTSNGQYTSLPQSANFTAANAYIESLPPLDSPELFGMTENAEKAYSESLAKELTDTMASVQPNLTLSLPGVLKTEELVFEMLTEISQSIPNEVITSIEANAAKSNIQTLTLNEVVKLGSGQEVRKLLRSDSNNTGVSRKEKDVIEVPGEVKAVLSDLIRSALFTVLRQEVDRFNHLLFVINESIKQLKMAVCGNSVMSDNLDEMYAALMKHKVPREWKLASYESCKSLASWVKDLAQRVKFFSLWSHQVTSQIAALLHLDGNSSQAKRKQSQLITTNQPPSFTPRSFWLSAFFFPQGFLTAVLQSHARKLGVSVDELTFHFHVVQRHEGESSDTSDELDISNVAFKGPEPPAEGVLIFGLYLDGAQWSDKDHVLADSGNKGRFSSMPEIHFEPTKVEIQQSSDSSVSPLAKFRSRASSNVPLHNSDAYLCPIYYTSKRAGALSSTGHSTNFIMTIDLPSQHPTDFWTLRGVALLCQLDD